MATDPWGDPIVDPWGDPLAAESSTVGPSPIDVMDPMTQVNWNGRLVPLARIQEVAAARGHAPESVLRLGTPQGQFESRLAKSWVGQTFLRLEQGLSDLAVAGLDLVDRAGLIDIDREKLQGEQRLRDDFLAMSEEGSDIQALLGDSGSRIYNNIVRSGGKVAAAGTAGTMAVYSAIGAESYDNALNQAEAEGVEGLDATIYAGKQAAVELTTMAMMGAMAKQFGGRTFEESFSRGSQRAVKDLLKREGIFDDVKSIATGAAFESGEEGIVALGQQILEMQEGFRTSLDIPAILEAGATGALATTSVQTIQKINEKLVSDEFQDALADTTIAVQDGKEVVEVRSTEEIQDILDKTDDELKTEGIIPEDATPAYTDAIRGELESEVKARQESAASASEVTASEVSSEGIPIPDTKQDQVDLFNFVVDTEDVIRDPTLSPTTARHADLNRDAALFGFNTYFNPGGRTRATVQAEAKAKGIPEKALSIAHAALESGRILNDYEQEGLTIKFGELKGRASDLAVKLNAATDSVETESFGAELDRVSKEAELIRDAIARSRTGAALNLVHGKFAVENDYDPVSVGARVVAANKGPVSEEVANRFRKKAGEHETLQAEVDKLQKEVSGKQALETLKRSPKDITEEDVIRLNDAAKDLFKGGCDF